MGSISRREMLRWMGAASVGVVAGSLVGCSREEAAASRAWRQAVRVQSAAFNNALYSDHRNTLEQVHVVGGVQAGTWRVIVRSGGLAMAPQPFAMMISAQ